MQAGKQHSLQVAASITVDHIAEYHGKTRRKRGKPLAFHSWEDSPSDNHCCSFANKKIVRLSKDYKILEFSLLIMMLVISKLIINN